VFNHVYVDFVDLNFRRENIRPRSLSQAQDTLTLAFSASKLESKSNLIFILENFSLKFYSAF